MITTQDKKDIASYVVNTLMPVLKKWNKTHSENGKEYLTTKEAAKMLGISEMHLRRLKLPHISHGDGQQARHLYEKDTLLENYLQSRYVSPKRTKEQEVEEGQQ